MNYVFNRFDDIAHAPLRIFNRVVFLSNLYADHGKALAEEYINLFTKEEKVQMGTLAAIFKEKGYKYTKELVLKNITFTEDLVQEAG